MVSEAGLESGGHEKKLQAGEEKTKLLEQGYNLFMQSPVAIQILKGPNLIVEFANDPTLKIWRKGREVIGMPLADVVPELVEQGMIDVLNTVRDTDKTFEAYETPVVFIRDGKEDVGYFNFIYKPYYEENRTQASGVMIFATEVTEQVLAKRALGESEERFRLMSDQLPQFIWMTSNSVDDIIYCNQTMLSYFGLSDYSKLIINKWGNFIHPDDVEAVFNTYKPAFTERNPYQVKCRFKESKSGKYRWFLIHGVPRHDQEGEFIGYIGTGVDINGTIEVEEKLEQLVKERTVQLERSNMDLQQFAHVASHDLKEPVRKIMIFARRLETEADSKLNEEEKSYLQKVQSAAERMNMMISGVLAYSMINAYEEIVEKTDLNEVIKNIETDLEILIEQKNAVIKYTPLPVIDGASMLLYQLFYNLINNSLKFAKADEPAMISIGYTRTASPKPMVRIILKDNGIGFDQRQAERIFDPFTRLNSKDKYEGTGLGLSLCKKIVQRHHGTIQAEGRDGEGASFVIDLPYTLK